MKTMRLRRLLVIGFDAMDLELTRHWAETGYLPTFRRLFESSAWCEFNHPPQYSSGVIWPSINTGLPPCKHDCYYLTRFLNGTYRVREGMLDDLKGDPFWKWYAYSGRRITLADVPFSVPKPEYGGRQFWGWCQHDWVGKKTSVPKHLLRELSNHFGTHPVPSCDTFSTESESLIRFRHGLLDGIQRRTSLLGSLVRERDWDLFYGAYCESHCAGHLLWHLEDETHPAHGEEQRALVGSAVRDVYAALDGALAELIAAAGEDAACALFFSHGMGPNYHGDHLFPEFLARFNRRWSGEDPNRGDAVERQRGHFEMLWQASVGHIPLEWRDRLKQQLPMHLRVKLALKRAQNAAAWERAYCFPLPLSDGFSAMRVNLAGREPHGRIRPGEYARHLYALQTELFRLTNTETGEPAVDRVFGADREINPMALGAGPDLIVWWSKSAPLRAVRSDTLGTISGEWADQRTGEHVMRGMFLLSHPQAKAGRCHIDMSLLDIAPTLCDVGGVTPETSLTGKSRRRDLLVD